MSGHFFDLSEKLNFGAPSEEGTESKMMMAGKCKRLRGRQSQRMEEKKSLICISLNNLDAKDERICLKEALINRGKARLMAILKFTVVTKKACREAVK